MHSRLNKNKCAHSFSTSRLRYVEILGRTLTSGPWYKTAHLLCTCAFPYHAFRGCKFSFVCFLYTVLEQYDLLNSTVLSEEITPRELTPWVNRWSMIIKELGNALGQLWEPRSISFRICLSHRQMCITIHRIRWHMIFIFLHKIALSLSLKHCHHRRMLEKTYHYWL